MTLNSLVTTEEDEMTVEQERLKKETKSLCSYVQVEGGGVVCVLSRHHLPCCTIVQKVGDNLVPGYLGLLQALQPVEYLQPLAPGFTPRTRVP